MDWPGWLVYVCTTRKCMMTRANVHLWICAGSLYEVGMSRKREEEGKQKRRVISKTGG